MPRAVGAFATSPLIWISFGATFIVRWLLEKRLTEFEALLWSAVFALVVSSLLALLWPDERRRLYEATRPQKREG